VQGLGFLESGITDPLNHFSNTLLEFSALLRHTVRPLWNNFTFSSSKAQQTQTTTDPLLMHLHSLLTYSHANRAVLKLRDQKQLDFEELSDYLSGVTAERDRLSAIISGQAGSSGLGLGAYLKDRVDALRGLDDDRSRVERMKKLDIKIKEVSGHISRFSRPELNRHYQLQDAVTTAHETSDAFSDETLREQAIFQHAKEAEMKEMLSNLADGQIEFYKAVCYVIPPFVSLSITLLVGNGRVGQNYTCNTTHSSGRLVAPYPHLYVVLNTIITSYCF
jgi:sorting nexin-4